MGDERDEVIERVRSTLKPLPSVDARSIARVLATVRGRAPVPQSRWSQMMDWVRFPSLSLARAASLAVVALAVGYFSRGYVKAPATDTVLLANQRVGVATTSASPESARASVATPGNASSSTPVVAASNNPAVEMAVPVQLVFEMKEANSVTVVSDFNGWNPDATPMQRLPGGRAWSVTVSVKPGRHVYAFVVDGTRWVADPRAPKAVDSDYGKPGSVLIVQAP